MKTPQLSYPLLAQALGILEVILKREDLHPYGSHKGRSIPLMIKHYTKEEGRRAFCISSSGNAALAAALTVAQHNKNNPDKAITLTIYCGEHIDTLKKERLEEVTQDDTRITIQTVSEPKQRAFQDEKNGVAKNLRQSTDDLALMGYHALAEELLKIENLTAVFVPTSSGTTAQGLAQAFHDRGVEVAVHIVQTSACHPMAEVFDTSDVRAESSLAHAIVDRVAHRKTALIPLLQQHHGFGWVVSNQDITDAITLTKKTCGLQISANSALSVAGLTKATEHGHTFSGAVACLITGE